MRVCVGPTGSVSKGHVMDCNPKAFERALKSYDSLLYVKWNPKKLKGWGCWEIRRQPTKLTAVYAGTYNGQEFYSLRHVEFKLVHHILDCAFLNYDAINKLKRMDTFNSNNWISDLEQKEAEYREKIEADAKASLKYAIKQHKSAARDLYELVRSGINPAQVLTSIKWGSNSA